MSNLTFSTFIFGFGDLETLFFAERKSYLEGKQMQQIFSFLIYKKYLINNIDHNFTSSFFFKFVTLFLRLYLAPASINRLTTSWCPL